MKYDEHKPDHESGDEAQDDALWNLLGKVNPPSVSPFFSRNVVREVRTRQTGFSRFFSRRWRFIPATAALGLLFCISLSQITQHPSSSTSVTTTSTEKADYDVISNLDDLMASNENSVWLADSNQ